MVQIPSRGHWLIFEQNSPNLCLFFAEITLVPMFNSEDQPFFLENVLEALENYCFLQKLREVGEFSDSVNSNF